MIRPAPFRDRLVFAGMLRVTIWNVPPDEWHRVFIEGLDIEETWARAGRLVASRHNMFVNTGLNIALDRLFGINGPPAAISHILLSSDNTTHEVGDTTLGGTIAAKAISPAASRTNQTVTAGAPYTQADVAFAIRKLGLTNTATDAGTGLIDYIGGSDNEPFTIDLTGVTSFNLLPQITITGIAS